MTSFTPEKETVAARDDETPIDEPRWAIIEIMGHRRHVGIVSEAEQFGAKMLRIDVPGPEQPDLLNPGPALEATFFYGGASIFGITPITEERGRAELARMRQAAAPARLGVRRDFEYADEDFDEEP